MIFITRLWRFVVFSSVLFCLVQPVQADLLMTAPPRESADAGLKQYGPLAERLSEILGENVIYQQPKGWLYYQRDIRSDKFDIVFDGPHFISWRIKRFGHTPVAKLPGTLGFIVVTKKDVKGFNDRAVDNIDDLKNLKICAIAPPNLSSLTVLSQYKDPVSLPVMINVKGGMNGVYDSFKKGRCQAAILRDKYYLKKVPQEARDKLKIIFTSEPIANQGITVSQRVTDEQRILITSVLTEINESTKPTLKRFAPKAEKMIFTDNADYEDYYKLLAGVVYGWKIE